MSCARALDNYTKFSRETLKQVGPWKVEVGLLGIKGCKLGLETRIAGLAVDDEVVWQGDFNGTTPVVEFLRPFYEKVCTTFGVSRWPEAEERLRRNFTE